MVLPVVVGIVGILFQVITTLTLQLSLTSLAAQAARDVARGEDPTQVLSVVSAIQKDSSGHVTHNNQNVCVTVEKELGWPVSLVMKNISVTECSLYAQ